MNAPFNFFEWLKSLFPGVKSASGGTPAPKTSSLSKLKYSVKASSFADPADVARFRRCKAQGNSDQVCFRVGDNGLGCWGDDTTVDRPMCALPREHWTYLGKAARGAKVRVRANGREIICELRDTMPSLANIKNGAGIDLNPAAVAAIGLHPPIMVSASWEFV